jgi:hypothetical protein
MGVHDKVLRYVKVDVMGLKADEQEALNGQAKGNLQLKRVRSSAFDASFCPETPVLGLVR